MVVEVNDIDVIVPSCISLMPVPLMGIQIYHHNSLHIPSSSHIVNNHRDIWINAKSSALRGAGVMKTA